MEECVKTFTNNSWGGVEVQDMLAMDKNISESRRSNTCYEIQNPVLNTMRKQ